MSTPCHVYVCPAPCMYCCTVAWRGAGGGTHRSAPGRTRRGANGRTRQRDGTSRRLLGSRRVSSIADADRCHRPRLLGGIISNHFIQTFVDYLRSQHKTHIRLSEECPIPSVPHATPETQPSLRATETHCHTIDLHTSNPFSSIPERTCLHCPHCSPPCAIGGKAAARLYVAGAGVST